MALMVSGCADYVGMSTIMRILLEEVGIDREITAREWGVFPDMIIRSMHEPFLLNWGGGVPATDPFFLLQSMFHSDARPASNRANRSSKRVDALFDKGAAVSDESEQAAVCGKVRDFQNQDPARNPVPEINTLRARKKILKSIKHSPGMTNYFGDAYFETQ